MNIIYVIKDRFPEGNAGALRAQNICRLLFEAGHSVHVIAGQITDDNNHNCYYTMEGEKHELSSIMKRLKNRKDNIRKLEKHLCEGNYDAILSAAEADVFWDLVRLREKYKVKLFIECHEWYHVSSYRLRYLDPRYYQMLIMMLWGMKRVDGVISISRLIHNYICSIGTKSVRIPSIFTTNDILYEFNPLNKRLVLIYAGNSGVSKELFAPIILTLASDKYLRDNIEFHIFGPSKNQVKKNVKNDNALERVKNSVIIHERVEHRIVEDRIRNADYMIFIRPNRKSSNAGFPTKMGECMSLGTPPITNDTGDISLYLNSWDNGVLLKEINENYIASILYKLLSLSEEKKNSMRKKARQTAEKYFNYNNYIDKINCLLGQ